MAIYASSSSPCSIDAPAGATTARSHQLAASSAVSARSCCRHCATAATAKAIARATEPEKRVGGEGAASAAGNGQLKGQRSSERGEQHEISHPHIGGARWSAEERCGRIRLWPGCRCSVGSPPWQQQQAFRVSAFSFFSAAAQERRRGLPAIGAGEGGERAARGGGHDSPHGAGRQQLVGERQRTPG